MTEKLIDRVRLAQIFKTVALKIQDQQKTFPKSEQKERQFLVRDEYDCTIVEGIPSKQRTLSGKEYEDKITRVFSIDLNHDDAVEGVQLSDVEDLSGEDIEKTILHGAAPREKLDEEELELAVEKASELIAAFCETVGQISSMNQEYVMSRIENKIFGKAKLTTASKGEPLEVRAKVAAAELAL